VCISHPNTFATCPAYQLKKSDHVLNKLDIQTN
jgi:hypothetical protein